MITCLGGGDGTIVKMRTFFNQGLAMVWLASSLHAQTTATGTTQTPSNTPPTPPPAAQSKPATTSTPPARDERLPTKRYVHRISGGMTLSVLIFPTLPNASLENDVATPVRRIADVTTTATQNRIGGGLTLQATVTNLFAVAASAFVHKFAFNRVDDAVEGVDNPNTAVDERKFTTDREDTRGRFLDGAVLLRRYSKSHTAPGARWFFEGGPSFRKATNIRTSIEKKLNDNTTCCVTTPRKPTQNISRGITAGLGGQFTDDFGIRLVPEVRYTRWFDQTFTGVGLGMKRNQVEAMVSLTF